MVKKTKILCVCICVCVCVCICVCVCVLQWAAFDGDDKLNVVPIDRVTRSKACRVRDQMNGREPVAEPARCGSLSNVQAGLGKAKRALDMIVALFQNVDYLGRKFLWLVICGRRGGGGLTSDAEYAGRC